MRGKAYWSTPAHSFESTAVDGEVVKPNATDVTVEVNANVNGLTYQAIVKNAKSDGWVAGTWDASNGTKGTCQARLYTCPDGSIILFGHWLESGYQYEWFTYLK